MSRHVLLSAAMICSRKAFLSIVSTIVFAVPLRAKVGRRLAECAEDVVSGLMPRALGLLIAARELFVVVLVFLLIVDWVCCSYCISLCNRLAQSFALG